MDADKKFISFVLPVYNEEEVLNAMYERLTKDLADLENKYSLEFVFINDGSKDKSIEILYGFHIRDKRVKIINLSRNFGHQMAITAGLDWANGDAVIIMDTDLQDPPKVSLELIKKWEEGYEVIYAQRKTRKDSLFKTITARYFYKAIDKFANINIPADTGDFRLVDKKVVQTIRKFRETNRFMRGLFSYVGFKQTAVLYDRDARFAGKTKYPLSKMIKLGIDGITSFSTIPLRFITQIGFLTSILSFLGIFYAIAMYVFFPEITVSGWTFMIITIFFMSGIQLITLGILGSYVGRIYQEIQGRPLYIIDSIMENDIKIPSTKSHPSASSGLNYK